MPDAPKRDGLPEFLGILVVLLVAGYLLVTRMDRQDERIRALESRARWYVPEVREEIDNADR